MAPSGPEMGNLFQDFIFISLIKTAASQRCKIEAPSSTSFCSDYLPWITESHFYQSVPGCCMWMVPGHFKKPCYWAPITLHPGLVEWGKDLKGFFSRIHTQEYIFFFILEAFNLQNIWSKKKKSVIVTSLKPSLLSDLQPTLVGCTGQINKPIPTHNFFGGSPHIIHIFFFLQTSSSCHRTPSRVLHE